MQQEHSTFEAYHTYFPTGKFLLFTLCWGACIPAAILFSDKKFMEGFSPWIPILFIIVLPSIIYFFAVLSLRNKDKKVLYLSIDSEYLHLLHENRKFPLKNMLRAYLFTVKERSGEEDYLKIQYKQGYYDIRIHVLDKSPGEILMALGKRGVKIFVPRE